MDRAVTSTTFSPVFILGALLPVVYIPALTGAIIPSGWLFLSAFLPFMLWNRAPMTLGHWLGLAFIAYASVSMFWSTIPASGVETLWHWAVLGMAFCVGTRLSSTDDLFRGLGIGMWLNALIAILSFAKVVHIPSVALGTAQAGLFFNPNMLGETSAIILIGLLWQRQWVLAIGPALCLAFSQSRLGLVAFFAVAIAMLVPPRLRLPTGAIGLALVVLLFLFKDGLTAVTVRTDIWAAAVPYLRFFGLGVGSLLMETKYGMVEHLHNDFLELAFEFGVGSISLMVLVGVAAIRDPRSRPVLGAYTVIACASFPSFLPVTGAVVALVAGAAYGDHGLDGRNRIRRGLAIPARVAEPRLRTSGQGPADVPV